MDSSTQVELKEALRQIASTISKIEKLLPKLKQGTPQHTLATRRIKAFNIASDLILKALGNQDIQ